MSWIDLSIHTPLKECIDDYYFIITGQCHCSTLVWQASPFLPLVKGLACQTMFYVLNPELSGSMITPGLH
jgi:hypothetical protein